MDNRIYKYLPENEILCKILLGFRAGHSTEYPVVEPIAQRSDSNPFWLNLLFLYALKTSKNRWFSDVFMRYRNEI